MANTWKVRQATAKIKSAGYIALKDTANIILDEAQRITPIDTGELETSGKVDGDYHDLTVYVSFTKLDESGESVAIIQHENPLYQHAPGKEYKYLEKPALQLGPALLPYVIKEELEKVL